MVELNENEYVSLVNGIPMVRADKGIYKLRAGKVMGDGGVYLKEEDGRFRSLEWWGRYPKKDRYGRHWHFSTDWNLPIIYRLREKRGIVYNVEGEKSTAVTVEILPQYLARFCNTPEDLRTAIWSVRPEHGWVTIGRHDFTPSRVEIKNRPPNHTEQAIKLPLLSDVVISSDHVFTGPHSLRLAYHQNTLDLFDKDTERLYDLSPVLNREDRTQPGVLVDLNGKEYFISLLTYDRKGSPSADIQVDSPYAIALNAQVGYEGGRLILQDLGGAIPTVVHGEKIKKDQKVALTSGDKIQVAHLEFTL